MDTQESAKAFITQDLPSAIRSTAQHLTPQHAATAYIAASCCELKNAKAAEEALRGVALAVTNEIKSRETIEATSFAEWWRERTRRDEANRLSMLEGDIDPDFHTAEMVAAIASAVGAAGVAADAPHASDHGLCEYQLEQATKYSAKAVYHSEILANA